VQALIPRCCCCCCCCCWGSCDPPGSTRSPRPSRCSLSAAVARASLIAAAMRALSSPAALLVKVTTRMWAGGTP